MAYRIFSRWPQESPCQRFLWWHTCDIHNNSFQCHRPQSSVELPLFLLQVQQALEEPWSGWLRSHAHDGPDIGPAEGCFLGRWGASAVGMGKVSSVLSSILYSYQKPFTTQGPSHKEKVTDRHKTAWFASFHQLDLPVERKQSLSKSQLSFCLFRKIPIKDKANFN